MNFFESSLTDLVAHIVATHHRFTKEEMLRLNLLFEKVTGVHGARHPELGQLQALFHQLVEDLSPHMMKEENVLFPYIVRLEESASTNAPLRRPPFMTVQNPIRMMLIEHETVGEILRDMRRVSSDYESPADACISYRTLYRTLEAFERDLHQHIHLENNVLFPRAANMESFQEVFNQCTNFI